MVEADPNVEGGVANAAADATEADKVIAKDQLFIPIARPLRWSLVTPNLGGFAENARAIHPLNRLASTQN